MKHFKLIVISLTFIHLCTFGVLAEENATITGDDLRIRGIPSTSSDILGTVNKGTRVEALSRTSFFEAIDGINAHWYAVRYQDTEGYVFGGYLNMDWDATVPVIAAEDLEGIEIPEQKFRVVWEAAGHGKDWWSIKYIRYSNGVLYCFDHGDGVRPESVMLVDALSGEELWTLEGTNVWYRDASFPPFEELVYYYEIFSYDPSSDSLIGSLTAFDIRSGERVWSFDPGSLLGEWYYFPTFGDGKVFIANAAGRCWALDADTGRVVWDRVLGENCDNPYFSNGTLYVMAGELGEFYPDYDCSFHAIHPSTGETIWENDSCPDFFVFNRYTPSEDMLYSIDFNTLTALNTHSGDEVWSCELKDEIKDDLEVYKDTLFVLAYGDETMEFSEITLYALDRSTGSEMWRFSGFTEGLGCLPPERPVEVADGRVYLMATSSQPKEGEFYTNQALTVLDAETGRTLWTFDEDEKYVYSVAVLDDNVYCGLGPSDSDLNYGTDFLMVLNAASGEEVMRIEIKNLFSITTDGERIYILSDEFLLAGEEEGDVLSSLEFLDR